MLSILYVDIIMYIKITFLLVTKMTSQMPGICSDTVSDIRIYLHNPFSSYLECISSYSSQCRTSCSLTPPGCTEKGSHFTKCADKVADMGGETNTCAHVWEKSSWTKPAFIESVQSMVEAKTIV